MYRWFAIERLAHLRSNLGVLKSPSDGKEPESVVFIACAGSRDPQKAFPIAQNLLYVYRKARYAFQT
jgi:heterodisulfide reductase subunit A